MKLRPRWLLESEDNLNLGHTKTLETGWIHQALNAQCCDASCNICSSCRLISRLCCLGSSLDRRWHWWFALGGSPGLRLVTTFLGCVVVSLHVCGLWQAREQRQQKRKAKPLVPWPGTLGARFGTTGCIASEWHDGFIPLDSIGYWYHWIHLASRSFRTKELMFWRRTCPWPCSRHGRRIVGSEKAPEVSVLV